MILTKANRKRTWIWMIKLTFRLLKLNFKILKCRSFPDFFKLTFKMKFFVGVFTFIQLALAIVTDLDQLQYNSDGKLASHYLLSTEAW